VESRRQLWLRAVAGGRKEEKFTSLNAAGSGLKQANRRDYWMRWRNGDARRGEQIAFRRTVGQLAIVDDATAHGCEMIESRSPGHEPGVETNALTGKKWVVSTRDGRDSDIYIIEVKIKRPGTHAGQEEVTACSTQVCAGGVRGIRPWPTPLWSVVDCRFFTGRLLPVSGADSKTTQQAEPRK